MTAYQVRRTHSPRREMPIYSGAARAHGWRALLGLTSARRVRSICAEAER